MQLNREKKDAIIKDVGEKFKTAEATFVADYSGITANNMTELRSKLREAGVEFRIVRNTLAKRALAGTDIEALGEHLKGTMAIAFSFKDSAAAAKVLTGFAKTDENLEIKMGTLGAEIIDLNAIKQLSELPSRDELIAKLAGALNNVPGSLAGVLSAIPRSLVYALKAVADQKG